MKEHHGAKRTTTCPRIQVDAHKLLREECRRRSEDLSETEVYAHRIVRGKDGPAKAGGFVRNSGLRT